MVYNQISTKPFQPKPLNTNFPNKTKMSKLSVIEKELNIPSSKNFPKFPPKKKKKNKKKKKKKKKTKNNSI